jgi:hypothetical protein
MKNILVIAFLVTSILVEGQRDSSFKENRAFMLESYFLTWRHNLSYKGKVYKYTTPSDYIDKLDTTMLKEAVESYKAPSHILKIKEWSYLSSRLQLYDVSIHFNPNLNVEFLENHEFDIKIPEKKRFEAILFFKNILIVQYESIGYINMDILVFHENYCNYKKYHVTKSKFKQQ